MRSVKSFSSWFSSRTSNPSSHLTILRPTESVPSDVLSVFGGLMGIDDNDHWSHRMKFICRTICFCLGPSNIWRFPRQLFYFGNATYLYLYMIYVWVFGSSLFIFELGQSQYYSKGFAKLYNICPVMGGIPLSMVFYCMIATMLYSMINVYSFIYIISAFYAQMAHSHCADYLQEYQCDANSANQTKTPEYLYFFHYVVEAADVHPTKPINWRNVGILLFVLVLICVIIGFAIVHYHWIQAAICAIMILALLYMTIISFYMEGSADGFQKMFVPSRTDLTMLAPWVYSIEQSLVTLGIGTGPLTTFWSISKLRILSYRDCFYMNGAIFICTILSGIIFFNAAGTAAHRKNSTIENYFSNPKYDAIQTHVIITEAINSMIPGLNNFTIFTFYLLLCLSCCYTLLEYIQLFLLYINSFPQIRQFARIKIVITTCLLFLLITGISATKIGYELMMSIDKSFIGIPLLFIVSCEMISMVYFFGLRNLCDDIEFVIGFVPNYYLQITWLCLPSLLLLCFIFSIYVEFLKDETTADKVVVCLISIVIFPIIAVALFKLIMAVKHRNFARLIRPGSYSSGDIAEQEERSRRYSSRR